MQHILIFLSGSTALGVLAHAVNTFPTPENKYGQWVLGTIKYAVGQRASAANAIAGNQTEVIAVTNEQQTALAAGNTIEVSKTDGVLKPTNGNGTQH